MEYPALRRSPRALLRDFAVFVGILFLLAAVIHYDTKVQSGVVQPSSAKFASFSRQKGSFALGAKGLIKPTRCDAQVSSMAVETGIDLKEYLTSKKQNVDLALDASIQSNCKETDKICEAMRYSLLAGGKRIRPILTIAACEMVGGTEQDCMAAAIATEMIHTMSLIHDDLPSMDNDDLRRGMPTSHVKYGEDVAILAGDALLSESFAHVAKQTPKSVPADRIVEVIRILGDSVGPVGLAGGQIMDLECEGKQGVKQEDLVWIHRHKTGALLRAAVASGATIGGASDSEVDACIKYAESIGLAFQVADDILDVTQSAEVLGKTAGKDEATDKTTYVKLLGLEGARAEAQRLAGEAIKALEPFGEKAGTLKALAGYIVNRNQ